MLGMLHLLLGNNEIASSPDIGTLTGQFPGGKAELPEDKLRFTKFANKGQEIANELANLESTIKESKKAIAKKYTVTKEIVDIIYKRYFVSQ